MIKVDFLSKKLPGCSKRYDELPGCLQHSVDEALQKGKG
jgi:hypothetical protein